MKKIMMLCSIPLIYCLISAYNSISANENTSPSAKIEIPEVNKDNCTNNKGLDGILSQLALAEQNQLQIDEQNLIDIKDFSDKCLVLIKQY